MRTIGAAGLAIAVLAIAVFFALRRAGFLAGTDFSFARVFLARTGGFSFCADFFLAVAFFTGFFFVAFFFFTAFFFVGFFFVGFFFADFFFETALRVVVFFLVDFFFVALFTDFLLADVVLFVDFFLAAFLAVDFRCAFFRFNDPRELALFFAEVFFFAFATATTSRRPLHAADPGCGCRYIH